MSIKSIIGTTCACLAVISFSVNSALVSRLDGNAYYNDAIGITLVKDANLASTMGFDTDGLMSWNQSQDFITSLNNSNYLGFNDWRLPTADPACGQSFNCTGSELGYLYYNDFSLSAGQSVSLSTNSNVHLFENMIGNGSFGQGYWSGTTFALDPRSAWFFTTSNLSFLTNGYAGGYQDANVKATGDLLRLGAFVVRTGDSPLNVVPIPAAVWLFGSGFFGLIWLARRKV